MTKKDLICTVVEKHGLPKEEMKRVIEHIFTAITDSLARGEKVSLRDFGTFSVKEHAAKAATGVCKRDIPARKLCKFSPSQALKTAVMGT